MNLLAPVSATSPNWKRRRIGRAIIFAAILCISGLFTASAATPKEEIAPILAELSPPLLWHGVGKLFLAGDRNLNGETNDRVNILLLGIGGQGHDGPQLTDTIILLSYKPSTKQLAFLSIPRDLAAEIPGYGWRKINAVNAYAEAIAPGSGGRATADAVGKLLNIDIPYYVRVDFAGFTNMVDELDGVLVHVDRSFTDSAYPAPNDLYQIVSFKEGWQQMSGERALIYARSRHGSNGEGSDFARSKRQQKILTALKDELLSSGVLTNPAKVARLFGIVAAHIQTNITSQEILQFAGIARDINPEAMIHRTLEPEANGALHVCTTCTAYMLVPANNTYDAVRALVADIFDQAPSATEAPPLLPTPTTEKQNAPQYNNTLVEIQNGTTLTGFATKAANAIRSHGFTATRISNAESTAYERTVIYDLTGGARAKELRALRQLLDADISVTLPEWFAEKSLPPALTAQTPTLQGGASSAHFLVILGKSSATLLEQ
jgi:LCP family protein required for cell wall assembly